MPVPFQAHLELLHFFLAHRDALVQSIEGLLNAQGQPAEYLQDASLLRELFEDCFFRLNAVTPGQSRLRGQLEEAHWASKFRPREMPGVHNGPIDPAEMTTRVFYLWRQTRWPGRNGRVRYAHTLFNLYMIRTLELLSLRLWDASSGAGERLSQLQGVLDDLWKTSPSDQPVFVRDARWLIQLAQSPATDELSVYFDVAEQIATTFSENDRIEIHKAGVCMAAGHLRSQIRYYATKKNVPFDDPSVVLLTRTSNALDFAILIQELVPLLTAYQRAASGDDARKRLELADVILQGVSPDPELFLNRVDLLGAYSMIEHLFVTIDSEGLAAYTPMGLRHVQLLQEYEALIRNASKLLAEDGSRFRPVTGAYSPYGILYGFSSHLLEHMALKASQPDAVTRFGIEDVFTAGDADKLAWVGGWRKLPHLSRDVEKQFDYPQPFAEDIFNRIEQALRRRAPNPTGRFVLAHGSLHDDSKVSVTDGDRREGRCLVSFRTPDGWVGISKAVLTEVLAEGRDANVAGLPPEAVGVLTLMCPGLLSR